MENTVIGCIATNAKLDKAGTYRVADLAHSGIVRAVRPAHTSMDGDAIFALATGEVSASVDLVAELAAEAVNHRNSTCGVPCDSHAGFPVDPRATAISLASLSRHLDSQALRREGSAATLRSGQAHGPVDEATSTAALEELRFDNQFTRELPSDPRADINSGKWKVHVIRVSA